MDMWNPFQTGVKQTLLCSVDRALEVCLHNCGFQYSQYSLVSGSYA